MAISVSHKKAYQYGVIALTILAVVLEVIAFGSAGWMRFEGTSRISDGQDTGNLNRSRRFLHQDAPKGREGIDGESGKDGISTSGETGGSEIPGDLGELAREDEKETHDDSGEPGSLGGQGEPGVSTRPMYGNGGQDKSNTLDGSNTQRRDDDTDKPSGNAENRPESSRRPFIPPLENDNDQNQISNKKADHSTRPPKQESTRRQKPSEHISNDDVNQRTKRPGSIRTKKPLTGRATRPTRPPQSSRTRKPLPSNATRPTRQPGSNRTKGPLPSYATRPTRPSGLSRTRKPFPSIATRPTRPPGSSHNKKPLPSKATRPTRPPGSNRTRKPLPSNATRPTRPPGPSRTKKPLPSNATRPTRSPGSRRTIKPLPSKATRPTRPPGSNRTKGPLPSYATRPTRPPGSSRNKKPLPSKATRPTRPPGSNRTREPLPSNATRPTRPPGSSRTKKPLPSNATRPTRSPGSRRTRKPLPSKATRPTRSPVSRRTKKPLPSNATRPTRLSMSRRTKNPRKNNNQGNTILNTRKNNGRRITTTTPLMQEKGKTQVQSTVKGQWVTVEIGLWTAVVCQNGLQGDRTLCIRTDGDFTSQGSSTRSMTEIRIEAVFALMFGFLGSAAILLLMTSSCLSNKKSCLLVAGTCGLVISGVLVVISIVQAMTINSMALEQASREYNGVNMKTPWCLIVGGLGAGLAFVIAGILATSKWAESRQKWTEFSNEITFSNESFENPTQESSG